MGLYNIWALVLVNKREVKDDWPSTKQHGYQPRRKWVVFWFKLSKSSKLSLTVWYNLWNKRISSCWAKIISTTQSSSAQVRNPSQLHWLTIYMLPPSLWHYFLFCITQSPNISCSYLRLEMLKVHCIYKSVQKDNNFVNARKYTPGLLVKMKERTRFIIVMLKMCVWVWYAEIKWWMKNTSSP